MQNNISHHSSLLHQFFLMVLLCFPVGIHAFPVGPKHPLTIESDTAEVNRKAGMSVYTGNVKIDQDLKHIRGDKVTTHFNKKNQFEKISIEGNPAHAWVQLRPEKPEIHAYAKIIHYYPQSDLLLLEGNAEIQQENDIFHAEKIRYQFPTHQTKLNNATVLSMHTHTNEKRKNARHTSFWRNS